MNGGFRRSACAVAALAVSAFLAPNACAALFDEDDALFVVIEGPIRELVRHRRSQPEYPATIHYTDVGGEPRSLPITITSRGHSRLEMCEFPPVKIRFEREQTTGTLFEGLRNVKLVTRCMRSIKAKDWVFLEYGIYRAYNAITPESYRVRLLNLTWRDTDPDIDDRNQRAFLIEPDKRAAARLGLDNFRPPSVAPEQMAPAGLAHFMLFQYLIGNTDFAVKRGPSGEGCCHNSRVFAAPGADTDFVFLPYDFDQSGMVNTTYARPDTRLGIRRVTSRAYRGFCWHNAELADSVRLFNEKRADIEAAFPASGMSRRQARRVHRFIRHFYNAVNDPKELGERLLDQCRGPESLLLRASPVSPVHVKTP